MTDHNRCVAARSLLQQVEQAKEAGRFAAAVELATQALALAREHGDAVACGHSMVFLATMHWRMGRFEEAYSAACAAYRLPIAEKDVVVRLRALATCALVRTSIGDSAAAIDLLRHALRSVNGIDAPGVRSMMLYNLAEQLIAHGEHQEAIQCLLQSLMLAERATERPGLVTYCASELARARVRYADHLADSGCDSEAQAQRRHAANVLPPLDASAWRAFNYLEYSSLQAQVEVCAALGHADRARRAAAAQFLFARRIAPSLQSRVEPVATVSQLYWRLGQPWRAIRYGLRTLSLWQAIGDEYESLRSMRQLATMYAHVGRHAEALKLRKDMMVSAAAAQAQRSTMSRRLAVIEREVESQLADAKQNISHAQQLSIIGRLIGQIHHALQAPIQRTQQLCLSALQAYERGGAEGRSPQELASVLTAISRSVDEASNLSRQLKIYAYRSSAITATLSIDKSLREVWSALRPHINEQVRELRVRGDTGLQVRADPQRLGVLLTLMLIELMKEQSSRAAPVVIEARIDAEKAGCVALTMNAALPAEATQRQGVTASLIECLCKEIAAEMDATLACTYHGSALQRCALVLLDAERERV